MIRKACHAVAFCLAAMAAVLSLASCHKAPESGKPIVFVTIEPLRFLAEQVGGDRFEVVTMVPGGGNPETYEPTPRQMMALHDATGYVMVGQIGFELTWMERIQANAPQMKVLDSSNALRQITPVESTPGVADPHTWMSTTNALVIADNLTHFFATLLPADKAYFEANAAKLKQRIEKQHEYIESLLSGREMTFGIYHPILTYFANDYHLRQIPVEEEGREPTARQLQQRVTELKQRGAKVMFVQQQFDTRNAEMVAREAGMQVVSINPLSYDWFAEMKRVADELCRRPQPAAKQNTAATY